MIPAPLARAPRLLADRLAQLEERIHQGDANAWSDYLATLRVLMLLDAQVAPGNHGELLSTKDMAARLGVSAKTLLKHKAAGKLRPALVRGKLIRWKGDEAVR